MLQLGNVSTIITRPFSLYKVQQSLKDSFKTRDGAAV